MNIPSVLFLQPNRVRRSYVGGYNLELIEGRKNCSDSFYPEDWIASTVRAVNDNSSAKEKDAGISTIEINGKEMLFDKIVDDCAELVFGPEHIEKYGRTMPFLQKLLDSSVRLHFQVHPDIPFARKYLNSDHGKTEAYLILKVRDEIKNPYIYLGFQRPLGKNELKKAILDQDIEKLESCFDKIPVHCGDVFLVPGGLPHAIGEGIMLLEVMEPADFTFVPEFTRHGLTLSEHKRYMGLDIDKCLQAVDYKAYPLEKIKAKFMFKPQTTKDNRNFRIERLLPAAAIPFNLSRIKIFNEYESGRNRPQWLINIVIKGEGEIYHDSGKNKLKPGDKFLIPYSSGEYLIKSSSEEMTIIQTTSV
ncbi:MAG: class I mannose-6-phosphate isomerase [Victivallales bacterium]